MTLASAPPPLAWYGSSFAYFDDPPTDAELDAAAVQARDERLAEFSPEQFGASSGGGSGSGVALGRFLPLHEGHRYLLEFARAVAPDLHVFVRVGAGDPVPWEVRRNWLAELFPGLGVTPIEDGPTVVWSTVDGPTVEQTRWTAQILATVRPDYVFAGESYGPELASRLGARFVNVDRHLIPVAGTDVRADPWKYERYLPPPVRAWYARRVCLIGPESTGKTSLASELAEHYGTVWVTEQLRTGGKVRRAEDITFAARAQQAAEDALARRASRVLFCDAGLLSVRLWSERLFGAAPDWLRRAAEDTAADLYLLTTADRPFFGYDAFNTPTERRDFFGTCERELIRLGRPYVTISGNFEERCTRAIEAVDALLAQPAR